MKRLGYLSLWGVLALVLPLLMVACSDDDPVESARIEIDVAGSTITLPYNDLEPREVSFTSNRDWTVEVPADGNYCLFARVMFDTKPVSHHDSLFFGIDGAPMIAGAFAHQYEKTEFNKTQWIQFFDAKFPKRAQWPVFLKKGRHTIRISPREEINIGMIAITLNPQAFRGK